MLGYFPKTLTIHSIGLRIDKQIRKQIILNSVVSMHTISSRTLFLNFYYLPVYHSVGFSPLFSCPACYFWTNRGNNKRTYVRTTDRSRVSAPPLWLPRVKKTLHKLLVLVYVHMMSKHKYQFPGILSPSVTRSKTQRTFSRLSRRFFCNDFTCFSDLLDLTDVSLSVYFELIRTATIWLFTFMHAHYAV